MNDCNENDDILILLAVVECQSHSHVTNPASTRLHKVRIFHRDLRVRRNGYDDKNNSLLESKSSSQLCTGVHLYKAIIKQCYHKIIGDDGIVSTSAIETMQTNSRVEIYNDKECQFETIFDHSHGINCSDIVKMYGNRIRCTFYKNDLPSEVNDNTNTKALQIMGRYFPFNSNGIDFAGRTLVVKEEVNNKSDGTGLNVWDGALLLAFYLERFPDKVKCKTVLELGSGTGFVGIAASILGARETILTDLEYTLDLMNQNISLNQNLLQPCTKLKSMVCDWFDPLHISLFEFSSTNPEVILVADCVWIAELVDPLINTLGKYCNKNTEVIISYQQRGKSAHEKFWKGLEQLFSSVDIIETGEIGLNKPESLSLITCRK